MKRTPTKRSAIMEKYKMQLFTRIFFLLMTISTIASTTAFAISEETVKSTFAGNKGAIVIIGCSTEKVFDFFPADSSEMLAPCSTFKIWNTLIGLECGLISKPEEMFYIWDGEKRFIEGWNQNLTLKMAFQASCVPAFKNLAKKIGLEKMKIWIDKISFGNKDISAGIDCFWLPQEDGNEIKITPLEQAKLVARLVNKQLPFSEQSVELLKEIMKEKETQHGILYGKTGSAADNSGNYILGWFVGFVESHGETFAFACAVKGKMGKDARAIIEEIFSKQGLL